MASKPSRKVKGFRAEWTKNFVDGYCVGTWLTSDPTNTMKARCLLCPPRNAESHRTFSIAEGWTAIPQHSKTAGHQQCFMQSMEDPDRIIPARQLSIHQAVKNQEEISEADRKRSHQLQKSQLIWSNAVHFHGLPSTFFDCSAELFPRMFPDSKLAADWGKKSGSGMHRTKGDYVATHGIFPQNREALIKNLQNGFFSLNFDESSVLEKSQLDINVSYLVDFQVRKQNFSTVSLEGGTTAQELVDAVTNELERNLVPIKNVVFVTTDGCSTMIGEENGVHALFRKILPHLPSWGGCVAHDASNILKSAVPKLFPNLTKLYSSLRTYLSSGSLHRKRKYEDVCSDNGLVPKAIPKMLDVRFRVIVRLAKWMEEDERCIYLFIKQLEKALREDSKKEPTDAEMTILQEYKGNYMELRLTNKFILDVSEPLINFLNYFESNEVRVHQQFAKIVDLVFNFLSKFLKNAGMEDEETVVTGKRILKVDFKNKKNHLEDEKIFLGTRVDNFLKEIGMKRNSVEIKAWMLKVRVFYQEVIAKMFKYFGPSLKSRTLRYLGVLSPLAAKNLPLDDSKLKWKYLAVEFPNIIESSQVDSLVDEVVKLKTLQGIDEEMDPDEFFKELANVKDMNGNKEFKLIIKLGSALLTGHNSSSNAERDFSIMNGLAADPRKNLTSQLRLNTRLSIKSTVHNMKHSCMECINLKKENKKRTDLGETIKSSSHCHCPKWTPSDQLISEVSSGKPYQKFKVEEKEKQDSSKAQALAFSEVRAKDTEVQKRDIEIEVQKFKRNVAQKANQKSVVEEGASIDAEEKKRKKKDKEEKAAEKRKKLSFIL